MNKIKNSFSKIKASDDFKNKLAKDLQNNQKELKYMKKNKNYKPFVVAASVLVILVGVASFNGKSNLILKSNSMISIPKMELSQENSANTAKMMPLIVYKGQIYLLSSTTIDLESAKKILGEKLGTTKSGITEWSKQDEYTNEFASTVGVEDIYSVKGYDKTFRIMTYTKNEDGTIYPQFFDCLNGVNIKSGKDIFGKLNIKDNITEAKYRNYSDWNNGVDNFSPIKDLELFNQFLDKVNKAAPILEENVEAELGDFRNDEDYKEISLTLKDGSKLSFSIIKNGYVHYGTSNVYFKLDNTIFQNFWNSLAAKDSRTTEKNTANVNQASTTDALLKQIKASAVQGKVINSEFTAKTTVIEDVKKKLGEPIKSDWIPKANGIYATYPKQNLVFGFNKGSQIFEVRSFDDKIKNLSLSQVKQVFGTPAYDVTVLGEKIIGYVANKDFKMLFVFPAPTSQNPNPLMNHYSVFYPRGTVNNMANYPGRQW